MSADIILKAQRLQVVRVSIAIQWPILGAVAKEFDRMSKVSCSRQLRAVNLPTLHEVASLALLVRVLIETR